MQALIPPFTISITLLVWYSSVRSNSLGCYNINDFLLRVKLSYSKLVKRGYEYILPLKYIMRFCWAFNIEGKYGETNSDILFWRMLKHNPFVSCIINSIKEINDIVKSSYVKTMPLTRSLECEWTNKSPLPTNVFDTVNAPVLTHWIQRAGGIIHVVWAMLPCVLECLIKIHPSLFLPDSNTEYTSGDTRIFSKLHPPLITNKHTNTPYDLKNPKFQCCFNSVLQFLFSIFRNNSYTSPFISSTEGTLLKCLFHTAHNARHSKDVDALKFLKFYLVRHDAFHNGQNLQYNTACLVVINSIHKGSLPDSNSTTYHMGASLSDILFSFVLEKYIVCDVWGLRSPSFESSSVYHISPNDTSSIQTWFYKDCNRITQILVSV